MDCRRKHNRRHFLLAYSLSIGWLYRFWRTRHRLLLSRHPSSDRLSLICKFWSFGGHSFSRNNNLAMYTAIIIDNRGFNWCLVFVDKNGSGQSQNKYPKCGRGLNIPIHGIYTSLVGPRHHQRSLLPNIIAKSPGFVGSR
jgi:hypothetical protein